MNDTNPRAGASAAAPRSPEPPPGATATPAVASPPAGAGPRASALAAEEELALRHVRKVQRFYGHAVRYAIVVAVLFAINFFVAPKHPWALWAALGWGIGLAFHAARVFELLPFWRGDWERRQVEKRLGRPL